MALVAGCRRGDSGAQKDGASDAGGVYFEDWTGTRGLPAAPGNWPDGTYATPEVTAGGVALLDYDNDGRLDVLQICHGGPGHFDEPTPNRLFHQEADGTFREVKDAGGLGGRASGQGVAVGDFDNDGFCDVFISNYGQNALYRNMGDGTFADVTERAGLSSAVGGAVWNASAIWVDYDGDGFLDLVVARFATFDRRVCRDGDRQEYCGPNQFRGLGCVLYHNNGDGTFSDVTAKAGLSYPGRGWGLVAGDLAGNGRMDIFVANDAERQNLWVNQGNGTFRDEALERGVAFNGAGQSEAGLGVAVGDVRNDGHLSLFITHIRNEKNTLYAPVGKGMYGDQSAAAGMAAVDIPFTGWGCGFCDFDNDGNLDVAVVNGRVARGAVHSGSAMGNFWNAYAEPNLLFRGDGHGSFTDMSSRGGAFTQHVECTRGLAFGDIDNDGRVDLVSNGIDNRLRVYRNIAPANGRHWLMVRALTGKRDALGARVELFAGGRRWTRIVQGGYGFESSSDPRVHFGLGEVAAADRIEVTWANGTRERFSVGGADRQVIVVQGRGEAVKR